jgi:alpha-D-ribose 1-methylphosphonate 5-triphosphate synthase subunit PhnL
MAMGTKLLLPYRTLRDDSSSLRRGGDWIDLSTQEPQSALRLRDNEAGYASDFIGYWLNRLILQRPGLDVHRSLFHVRHTRAVNLLDRAI